MFLIHRSKIQTSTVYLPERPCAPNRFECWAQRSHKPFQGMVPAECASIGFIHKSRTLLSNWIHSYTDLALVHMSLLNAKELALLSIRGQATGTSAAV